MRIAHFSNTYLPHINGVARSVSTFREALSRLGHQVFVFAPDSPADHEETEPYIFRYPGVQIPQFDYTLPVPHSRFISKLLPSLKLHVIHSNHPVALGSTAASYAEKLDLPLVFTFHTRYVKYADEYTDAVPFTKAFVGNIVVEELAKYLNRCHHVVTPSDSIKASLAKYAGLTERVTTIPTGIDLEPYRRADGAAMRQKHGWRDKKILVSVGRLATEKNVETLLKAAAKVFNQYQNAHLILIGDGPQSSDLHALVQELSIAGRVTFTGRIPFEQVPLYLKAADIFCFASVTETQGLVSMEALAAGLPVVAVNAGGTNDTVSHEQEGLLTDNTPAALAQAIARVLSDEALAARLKSGAEQKSKSFDMMTQARRMLEVYGQAIEDKKAGRKIKVEGDEFWARVKDDFSASNM